MDLKILIIIFAKHTKIHFFSKKDSNIHGDGGYNW